MKLTNKDEINLVADWKTGGYSQRDLASKYSCSKGKVSQLTKGIEKSQNGHIVDAQMTILSAKSLLSDEEMTAIMNTAQELAQNKNLVFGVTQKALKKLNTLVDETETANDLKTIIEASDRASLTLGVNPRFAPKTEINNTNAQQNNDNQIEVIFK
jgi:hypothetical protein